jgi:8-oxo-dGTP pyrophosphatase MutT (NUDIX family)
MSFSIFSIGVSGHQNLGDDATEHFVAQQVRELLRGYQQEYDQVIVYSALAKGADQLFVQIALEERIPVDVVIPCAEYETIFASDAEKTTYQRLLRASRVLHHLPVQTCSDDAFLAAGQWIVDRSDLMLLAWNGWPARGKGGTGDIASYARTLSRPFVHIHTRHHTVTLYGDLSLQTKTALPVAPKRTFTISKQQMYQGSVLTVNQYRLQMPDGKVVIRDVVERPESVLVVPVSQGEKETMVLLTEEYDFGAETWQLTLPGGKVEQTQTDGGYEQAQKELRQEIGYRAGSIEKLTSFYSHPGYVSHKVHLFIAQDLEWDPLEQEAHEELRVHTYPLQEALVATLQAYRFDPEAALALYLYDRQRRGLNL